MLTIFRGILKMKAAAIQMCSSSSVDENLFTAAQLIRDAAANSARLVVLPEMFPIMGKKPSDKVVVKEVFGEGKIQAFLAEEARRNKIWIVGGTIPIACASINKVRAASLLYNDRGELVARYDKIHLFDVVISESESYKESDTTESGNDIVVVETPFGKLGMAVCYDLRFPELFRRLANAGAEIISVPSAFTTTTGAAHWELLCRSRAVENSCYVIGACQGGLHASGRETYGHSLLVDPWGDFVEIKGNRPGVVYTTIDLDRLHEIRRRNPVLENQRIFATKGDQQVDASLTAAKASLS